MALHRGAIVDHAVAVHDAQHACRAALERLEPHGIGLRRFAGRVDLVVQHHEHALAL
jgi:hypothetical protein